MKNTTILLALLFMGKTLAGQGNAELSALIQKTLANYPRLREAELATSIAAQKTGIARAGFLPNATGNASFNYLDPITEVQFGPSKVAFQPHDNYNINVGASGLAFDFGRTKAAIQKAVAEENVGKITFEAAKQNVAFQVAQLFYGIVFTKKSMAVSEGQMKSLQANQDLLAAKLRNGDALELDVLNAEVAIANATNRLTDLRAQLEKQQALLASLTGEAAADVQSKQFDFQEVMAAEAPSGNFDIALAKARTAVAEQDLAVSKKYLRPSLNYNAGLGYRNGYVPDIHEWRFNWVVGAGITYPLYVGGKDRKYLKISELSILNARSAEESAARTADADLAAAQADRRAAAAKLKSAQVLISQAKQAVELANVRFKNGVATNVDVLTAQANSEQAELSQVAAEYQNCLAGLMVLKVSGKSIQ